MLPSIPSLEVAAAVWVIDGSAAVEVAAVSACCCEGSPTCVWLGDGLSEIEAGTKSFGNTAEEAILGCAGGTTGSAVCGSTGTIRSTDRGARRVV